MQQFNSEKVRSVRLALVCARNCTSSCMIQPTLVIRRQIIENVDAASAAATTATATKRLVR